MQKYVAYYRKSPGGGKSREKLRDSFSIESQMDLVRKYAQDGIIGEYTEIESGRDNSRLELKKAIAHAKKEDAILIVAKVDRLGRNAAYIFGLIDTSGVKFLFANMPNATKLVIGVLALVAESEAVEIGARIKAGFVVKKNRGEKLGKVENFSIAGRIKGAESMKLNAEINENNVRAKAYVSLLGGTLESKCLALNSNGFKTSRGLEFKPEQVRRLLL